MPARPVCRGSAARAGGARRDQRRRREPGDARRDGLRARVLRLPRARRWARRARLRLLRAPQPAPRQSVRRRTSCAPRTGCGRLPPCQLSYSGSGRRSTAGASASVPRIAARPPSRPASTRRRGPRRSQPGAACRTRSRGIPREPVDASLVALQNAGSRPVTLSLGYRCLQCRGAPDQGGVPPGLGVIPPVVPEEPLPILRPEQIRAILDACAGTEDLPIRQQDRPGGRAT